MDAHHPDFEPVDSDESSGPRTKRGKSIDDMISDGTLHVPKYKAKASLKKLKDLSRLKRTFCSSCKAFRMRALGYYICVYD